MELQRVGCCALMVKLDSKSTGANASAQGRNLLGVLLNGAIYANGTLLFRFRPATKIFIAVAKVQEWIMRGGCFSLTIIFTFKLRWARALCADKIAKILVIMAFR